MQCYFFKHFDWLKLFKKCANPVLFFVYLRLFHITQFNKLMKVYMACLELEPGAAGWKAQTNPLSY